MAKRTPQTAVGKRLVAQGNKTVSRGGIKTGAGIAGAFGGAAVAATGAGVMIGSAMALEPFGMIAGNAAMGIGGNIAKDSLGLAQRGSQEMQQGRFQRMRGRALDETITNARGATQAERVRGMVGLPPPSKMPMDKMLQQNGSLGSNFAAPQQAAAFGGTGGGTVMGIAKGLRAIGDAIRGNRGAKKPPAEKPMNKPHPDPDNAAPGANKKGGNNSLPGGKPMVKEYERYDPRAHRKVHVSSYRNPRERA